MVTAFAEGHASNGNIIPRNDLIAAWETKNDLGWAQPGDAALIAKAKGIHERVLKLDTHNDIEPSNT